MLYLTKFKNLLSFFVLNKLLPKFVLRPFFYMREPIQRFSGRRTASSYRGQIPELTLRSFFQGFFLINKLVLRRRLKPQSAIFILFPPRRRPRKNRNIYYKINK